MRLQQLLVCATAAATLRTSRLWIAQQRQGEPVVLGLQQRLTSGILFSSFSPSLFLLVLLFLLPPLKLSVSSLGGFCSLTCNLLCMTFCLVPHYLYFWCCHPVRPEECSIYIFCYVFFSVEVYTILFIYFLKSVCVVLNVLFSWIHWSKCQYISMVPVVNPSKILSLLFPVPLWRCLMNQTNPIRVTRARAPCRHSPPLQPLPDITPVIPHPPRLPRRLLRCHYPHFNSPLCQHLM